MVTTGILLLQGKIRMVEPGIETGTSWLVVRSCDHQTTRLFKISLTDHVRNEEVLFRVKEQSDILHEISKRKANWIGHILR